MCEIDSNSPSSTVVLEDQDAALNVSYACNRVRDVGNNSLTGTIPTYLGNSLTSLYVLLALVLQ